MTLLHRFLMTVCLIVASLISTTGYATELPTQEKAKQI